MFPTSLSLFPTISGPSPARFGDPKPSVQETLGLPPDGFARTQVFPGKEAPKEAPKARAWTALPVGLVPWEVLIPAV